MTTKRLTSVQRDVIERLRDGWWIGTDWGGDYMLRKPGEASRHVAYVTFKSLEGRGIIVNTGIARENWTLA